MIEQASLFDIEYTPEEQFYQVLLPHLVQILSDNNLPELLLSFKQMKSYYTCAYQNNVCFRVHHGKNADWIEIPARYQSLAVSLGMDGAVKTGFFRITVDLNGDTSSVFPLLTGVLDRLIDICAGSFACCSRFMECSEVGKCIHPDPLQAANCSYRINLKRGRIFYGSRKTI